jgi:tetratricopeptide (TPR) repeat protein
LDIGVVLLELKRFDRAISSFQRALQIKSPFPEAQAMLGKTHLYLWDLERAQECLSEALKQSPELPIARQSLDVVAQAKRQIEKLVQGYENSRLNAGKARAVDRLIPPSEPALQARQLLPHLLNGLGLTGTGVEVGVQRGNFSEHLLRNWKGELLYSVDPWREFPSDDYEDIANVNQDQHDELYATTIRKLMRFGPRSVIWRLTSKQASALLPDESLDFCYLDADHKYEAIAEDIKFWFPKVKQGGILAGHDYIPDGNYSVGLFGVQRAVHELVKSKDLDLFISGEKQFPSWFVVKISNQ